MEFSNSRNADLFAAPSVNTLMQKTHNKNKSNLIFDVIYEGSQENLKWIMFIATNIFFKGNQPEMGFSKLKGTWI